MFRNPFVGFVLGVLVMNSTHGSPLSSLRVTEELLGEKGDVESLDKWAIAPDGERIAWPAKTEKHWVVKVDGDPIGPEFDEIKDIIFSPDGNRVAYRAKQGKNWVAVIDGKPGAPYREIGAIRFSSDSERVAYVARKGKKWIVLADGTEGQEYDDVRGAFFSPRNQHLIYPAKREKRWVMIIDGEEQGPEMREVFGVLGFMPGSESPVYLGRIAEEGWTVFKEYLPGPEFEIIAEVDFPGSAGSRFAYAGARIKKPVMGGERAVGQIVVDGVLGPDFEGESYPSGSRPMPGSTLGGMVATSVAAGVAAALSFGDMGPGSGRRFSARTQGVSSPAVSPDGGHVAYSARREDDDYVVFLDGEPGPSFELNVCNPTFTHDGRLFYVGVRRNMVYVMIDGVRVGGFAWNKVDACEPAVFSQDGAHYAFVALQGGDQWVAGKKVAHKRRLVVDGEVGPAHAARHLGDITLFAEGGELHWAYFVDAILDERRGAWLAVVDGLEGKHYDEVLLGSLRFTDSKTVRFIARSGGSYYRVTQELPSSPSSTEH